MFDILIKNGIIVDGSGEAAFCGDVAVKDGKIAKIAPAIDGEAGEVIDASGLQVTPGLIDSHTRFRNRPYRWSRRLQDSISAESGEMFRP